MSTVLITGTTGFLGSHLAKKFIKEGHQVIGLHRAKSNFWRFSKSDEDIRWFNFENLNLDEIFKSCQVDVVIHTACSYGRNGEGIKELFASNFHFGIEVLQASINSGVKTFINTDTLLPKNVNSYSLSKSLFVEAIEYFSQSIQVINLKLEHMYGPLDDRTKFVPWLISTLIFSKEIIPLTSGIQKRDFIFINDVVEGFYSVFLKRKELENYSSFDLSTGAFVEVRYFVGLIVKKIEDMFSIEIKQRLNFGAKDYRENDVMVPQLSSRNLSEIGWALKFSHDEGINEILKEYK